MTVTDLEPTPWTPFSRAVIDGPESVRILRRQRGATTEHAPEWRYAGGRTVVGHWTPAPTYMRGRAA